MSQVAVDAGEANLGDAEEAGEEEKEEGGGRGAWCGPPLVPVVLLQMVLGTVTAALALAMSDLSPSLRPRDTPYWAGLPVCLAATLGFYVQSVGHQDEDDDDEVLAKQFNVRLAYFLSSTIATVLSLTAASFAGYHASLLAGSACQLRMGVCECRLSLPTTTLPTSSSSTTAPAPTRTLRYAGVASCRAVSVSLRSCLVLQVLLNLSAASACLRGCYLLWKKRYQAVVQGPPRCRGSSVTKRMQEARRHQLASWSNAV